MSFPGRRLPGWRKPYQRKRNLLAAARAIAAARALIAAPGGIAAGGRITPACAGVGLGGRFGSVRVLADLRGGFGGADAAIASAIVGRSRSKRPRRRRRKRRRKTKGRTENNDLFHGSDALLWKSLLRESARPARVSRGDAALALQGAAIMRRPARNKSAGSRRDCAPAACSTEVRAMQNVQANASGGPEPDAGALGPSRLARGQERRLPGRRRREQERQKPGFGQASFGRSVILPLQEGAEETLATTRRLGVALGGKTASGLSGRLVLAAATIARTRAATGRSARATARAACPALRSAVRPRQSAPGATEQRDKMGRRGAQNGAQQG
jgi:hypothetical protein